MEPGGWTEEHGETTRMKDFQFCFLRPYQGNYLYTNDLMHTMNTLFDIIYIGLAGATLFVCCKQLPRRYTITAAK